MIDDDLETRRTLRELRAVVQRLTLVSHAPSQSFSPAPPVDRKPDRWRIRDTKRPVPHLGVSHGHSADSAIPQGGIDHKGDHTPEYRQKSADHFVRQVNRLADHPHRTYGATDLQPLLNEATTALEAWHRTPQIAGTEPEYGTPQWKRFVAETKQDAGTLARKFNVTRQYIHQIRREYRQDAA